MDDIGFPLVYFMEINVFYVIFFLETTQSVRRRRNLTVNSGAAWMAPATTTCQVRFLPKLFAGTQGMENAKKPVLCL
jgi:hypothetical protein